MSGEEDDLVFALRIEDNGLCTRAADRIDRLTASLQESREVLGRVWAERDMMAEALRECERALRADGRMGVHVQHRIYEAGVRARAVLDQAGEADR